MKTRRLLFLALAIAGLVGLWVLSRSPRPTGREEGRGGVPLGERTAVRPAVEPPPVRHPAASPGLPGQVLPPHIEDLGGPNATVRLQALAEAGPLSPADCEFLYAFLRQPTGDEKLQRMASIKNSVMNLLARQPQPPQPWDQVLQGLWEDEGQHVVIRDYALQHLFEYYEAALLDNPVVKLAAGRRAELRKLFWSALERKSESLAGTGLLALFHLSALEPAIDRRRVMEKALEFLAETDTGDLARITALQVCARAGESRALAPALSAAATAPTIPIRAAAIAAVGATGNAAELPLLKQLQAESNPSLRGAAAAAIRNIQARTNG